jgi:hypothetical protein
MQRMLVLLLGVLLLGVGWVEAQQGVLCKHGIPNRNGTNSGDIPVTAVPVTVVTPNTALCRATITNVSPLQPIRCRQVDGTEVAADGGFQMLPYQSMELGADAQLGWRCVLETTATGDAAVTVYEVEP